jgi:4-hydroxy-2-oxoglutarate aldolase
MLDVSGIFPPIPTPFGAGAALDIRALEQHLRFLATFPLRGVVVLGSNGEAVHLNDGERLRLLEAARNLTPASRLLIAGTGCPSTAKTVEMSQQAADIGADAVLVLPPHYYRGRMTSEALTKHFHAVADACRVPVIVYNMPACTGLDMSVETLCAIAEHPNIIGLKESGGDVVKMGTLHHMLGDGFQILAGSAGFLLPALSVGAVGGVLALANIAPAQCLGIWTAAVSGRWEEARENQLPLIGVNTAVTGRWGVAGLKAAMNLLGLSGGHVRAPLLDLEAPDIERLRSILMDGHVLEREEQGA